MPLSHQPSRPSTQWLCCTVPHSVHQHLHNLCLSEHTLNLYTAFHPSDFTTDDLVCSKGWPLCPAMFNLSWSFVHLLFNFLTYARHILGIGYKNHSTALMASDYFFSVCEEYADLQLEKKRTMTFFRLDSKLSPAHLLLTVCTHAFQLPASGCDQ